MCCGMIRRTATLTLARSAYTPLLYVAINVFVAMQWDGYSSASQTVSELSAIGAPTRQLWVLLGIVYTLLVTAFRWGFWGSARRNCALPSYASEIRKIHL